MKIKVAPKKPIAASSLEKTSRFYEDVLGLKSKTPSSNTLEVEEKLVYREESPWVTYVEESRRRVQKGNRTTEILLESDSLEEFLTKSMDHPEIRVIDPSQKRKKKSIKFYDPDNHIIEILERNN